MGGWEREGGERERGRWRRGGRDVSLSLHLILPHPLPTLFFPPSFFFSLSPVADSPYIKSAKLSLASTTQPALGPDVKDLDLTLEQVGPDILRVKLGAPGRWEVPPTIFKNTVPPTAADRGAAPALDVDVTYSPFSLAVRRTTAPGKAAGGAAEADAPADAADAPLFDSAGTRLVFKDQYLEISTAIPAGSRLYGLGEATSPSGIRIQPDGRPHTLWNHDSPAAWPGPNMYGSWPILLEVRPDGSAHGVLLLNSNGMDVALTNDTLTYRVIGGVLDFYFFAGPTPLAVIDQLTRVVGRPWLPPYWSLGLMQSKYGYWTVEECSTAVQGYRDAAIPLETFVSDSQYMDEDQGFTFGAEGDRFAKSKLKAFVADLHAHGQRWVPILDPVIHIKKGYKPYDEGVAADVFVKDAAGGAYVAQLWPGASHLPDFMKPQTHAWWADQIQSVVDAGFPVDGIWLDMNEVSNYCTGDVCAVPAGKEIAANNKFVCELECVSGAAASLAGKAAPIPIPAGIWAPPYAINNGDAEVSLAVKTLPPTAVHAGGVLEYDVHNLYAHYQSIATASALSAINGKRHFLFTRSSFVGTGAYAAHWTGDTLSSWDDLRDTLPAILSAGMAGIPFTGADICGFMKYASEELCARWIAAGAWYPYARDHHADGFQELWRWPAVAEVARKVLHWRYRALPHLYTAFADARAAGCPVARPMFFAHPADPAVENISGQWYMGDGLLVSPVLRGGRNATDAYFPAGTWYDLYDGSVIDNSAGKGRTVTLAAGMTDDVPLHIAGGLILPLGPGGLTTKAAREGDLTLVVAMPREARPSWHRCGVVKPSPAAAATPEARTAAGSMFYDGDGESVEVGPPVAGNRAAFDAVVAPRPDGAPGFTGRVAISWPGANTGAAASAAISGAHSSGAACPANATWPRLGGVVVRGVGAVDLASVKVSVPATGATALPEAIEFDPATDTLTLSTIGLALECPHEVVITFEGSKGDGMGTAPDTHAQVPIAFDPSCDCDDKPPPNAGPYTCAQQAAWGKCAEGFMYGFCKASCHTCLCDVKQGSGRGRINSDGQFSNSGW